MSTEIDIGQISEILNYKADIDLTNTLTNLSSTSSSFYSGIGMPSDTYVDLTPVSNHGLLTTAQAAGYVYVYGTGGSNAVLALISSASSITTYPSNKSDTKLFAFDVRPGGGDMASILPVKKGDKVWMDSASFTTTICRFVYAEGEI